MFENKYLNLKNYLFTPGGMYSTYVLIRCMLLVFSFALYLAKSYNSLRDELTRFVVFVHNLLVIEEQNARFAEGKTSFEMGINEFTDMVDLSLTLKLQSCQRYYI